MSVEEKISHICNWDLMARRNLYAADGRPDGREAAVQRAGHAA
jgi:hypothetical protein